MQNDDDRFTRSAIPVGGAVARAEESKTLDKLFKDRLASAEVLWSQKYNPRMGGQSPSVPPRPASVYTTCYCCGGKGHYSRDCKELAIAKCSYCHKIGHKEIVCRQKTRISDYNARVSASSPQHGEASFFHGRPAECNVITFGTVENRQLPPSTVTSVSTDTESSHGKIDIRQFNKNIWLADNGASHHICSDKSSFSQMAPYTGISCINSLNGSMAVTQVGTVELIVDGKPGKASLGTGKCLITGGESYQCIQSSAGKETKPLLYV